MLFVAFVARLRTWLCRAHVYTKISVPNWCVPLWGRICSR